MFDVVLMTGLPGSGRKVELDGKEVSIEVGDMIRRRMDEWEREEMARRVPGKFGKKRHFFRHCLNVMIELCDENVEADQLVWLELYAFIILSGVLFPRTPYGATWSVLRYVDDVADIDDTKNKTHTGLFSKVQLKGLHLLI